MKHRKHDPKGSEPKLTMRAGVIEVRAAEGDIPASVRMSVSSEEPVLTYGYFNNQHQRFYEILDHGEGSINMSRCKDGLVILDKHYGDQVGLMTVETKDRKLGGVVEFCTGNRAQEIGKDAAKGLRRNVSVGYTVAAESYRLEGDKDGIPVVRAMSWMPYEASFEPVPADTSVGVGRTSEGKPTAEKTATRKEEKEMDPKELAKLFERAASNGIEAAKVLELVEAGKGRAELDALIVEKQRVEIKDLKERKPDTHAAAAVAPIGEIGLTPKEARRYSFLNVIRAGCGDRSVDIGFERECSEAVTKALGRSAKGVFVPWDVMIAKRDLQIVGAGTGANIVATNLMASDFITALRNRLALSALGVPVITGLTGDVAIPKMSAVTGYWVAETAAPTESTPVLSQVTGTPRSVGGNVDMTRKLLMQTSVDLEAIVRNDIAKALAAKIDAAGFNGAGTSEPTGLLTGPISTDVSVTAGTPTFAEIANIIATVEDKAVDVELGKWAVTSEVFWKLATTATSTGAPSFIADYATSRILGAPAVRSGNVTANYGVFGDWSQMILAMWGNGLDLVVDPYTLSKTGITCVTGFMDVDIMIRNADAFAHADITT